MRLKTEIGDTIETVRPQTYGQHAGQRLSVILANEPCCVLADELIRKGTWRIVEECGPGCYCDKCERQGELI